jgi:D-alanine-D-alanine ligase
VLLYENCGGEEDLAEKIKVLVLFGGQSGEHEVSLISATSVVENLDREKFEIITAGIGLDGRWMVGANALDALKSRADFSQLTAFTLANKSEGGYLVPLCGGELSSSRIDVVFPVLHGPLGEDGALQGMLDMMGIPYVGAGVLGSALGMDKAAMKDVFRAHNILTTPYALVLRSIWERHRQNVLNSILGHFQLPLFIKPANMGSSVGISKAHDEQELADGLDNAAKHDRRLLVEACVSLEGGNAREFEVAVLGNDNPQASIVGEVVPGAEFYDYNDKYRDEKARLIIPAIMDAKLADLVRQMACRAFTALDLAGMARVDFLYGSVGSGAPEAYLNEVNTIPGFTKISMYPKLWEATGLSYKDLLTRLIELALERDTEVRKHRRT